MVQKPRHIHQHKDLGIPTEHPVVPKSGPASRGKLSPTDFDEGGRPLPRQPTRPLPNSKRVAMQQAVGSMLRKHPPPANVPGITPAPVSVDTAPLPVMAKTLLAQLSEVLRSQLNLGKAPVPERLIVSQRLEINILPQESPQRLITVSPMRDGDKEIAFALDRWTDGETRRIADRLQQKYGDKPPQELALIAASVSDRPDLNIWINLAILMVLGYDEWELHGVQFDPRRIEEFILADLRDYFESHDFSNKVAPEKITVLEDMVRCTLKTPNAAAGVPLSYEAVQNRHKHKRQLWLRLEQRDPSSNLEQPLRQAETSIQQQVEDKVRELQRRYPERTPRQIFAGCINYAWEDIAAYCLIRDKEPEKNTTE